ncbi:MAG: hypothetical protein K5925_01725 [Bacilli bacterium]|nr:hypothetical protein [Bacilli bacterium]
MITTTRLRKYESDLYDILDYELPAYHQIVKVKGRVVGSNTVHLDIYIKYGKYADPDPAECQRVVDQYIHNLNYDYKEIYEVYFDIYFK